MAVIYDPASPVVRADPYPFYARLRAEEPVYWHSELRCWFVTRYEDVAAALSGPSMSPDRLTPFYAAQPSQTQSTLAEMMRYLNLWMIFRDPPAHTRLRGLVSKAFLPGTILGFKPQIETSIDRLLSDLANKSEADLVTDFVDGGAQRKHRARSELLGAQVARQLLARIADHRVRVNVAIQHLSRLL